jgi:hypothetical protein
LIAADGLQNPESAGTLRILVHLGLRCVRKRQGVHLCGGTRINTVVVKASSASKAEGFARVIADEHRRIVSEFLKQQHARLNSWQSRTQRQSVCPAIPQTLAHVHAQLIATARHEAGRDVG